MECLKDIHEAVDSVLAQTLKPHEVIVAVDHNQELLHSLKSEPQSGTGPATQTIHHLWYQEAF